MRIQRDTDVGQGRPLRIHLTPGQAHDSTVLDVALKGADAQLLDGDGKPVAWPVQLGGDKKYCANWIDEYLLALGVEPVILSQHKERKITSRLAMHVDLPCSSSCLPRFLRCLFTRSMRSDSRARSDEKLRKAGTQEGRNAVEKNHGQCRSGNDLPKHLRWNWESQFTFVPKPRAST